MKVTKARIKQFEQEQQDYGTDVALFNFQWQIASGLFKDIGITSVKTSGGGIKPKHIPRAPKKA